MKRTTLFFIVGTALTLGLALYNKKRQNPTLMVAQGVTANLTNHLAAALQKAILLKAVFAFGAVTIGKVLCKKTV